MKLSDFLKDIGRPVAYFPKLAVILGGVKEAVFLAQIIYWSDKGSSEDEWIYKTQEELYQETGLSRREQEGARKTLRGLKILEERYARLEHKLYYRLDLSVLDSLWATFPNGGNRHSAMAETAIRQRRKPPFVYNDLLPSESTTESTYIDPSLNPSRLKNQNPLGATPQTPEESPKSTLFVDQADQVDKCTPCTSGGETAESVVKVWSTRLSMIPRMRGPGAAKRRQWIGELERWVKEDGGLTYQDVLEVLIFAMENDFWRSKVISPKALRKHWDTLIGQKLSSGISQDTEGVLAEFAQVYSKARGTEYVREGKDMFRAKDLLRQVNREEVSELVKEFFEREDDFLDKQGRTFSCFVSQVNRLRRKAEVGAVNTKLEKTLAIIRESRRKKEGGVNAGRAEV